MFEFADVRYSLRSLRQNPGFTIAAVAALALGIGANTAMFSVVNTVLLKPLPFRDAARIMEIFETEPEVRHAPVNMADYLDWKRAARSFESMAMYSNYENGVLSGGIEPQRIRVGRAESTLFPLLGVTPVTGRGFTAGENQPGRGNTAVLSNEFWRNRLGGVTGVLGRKILVDGEPLTVVGVLPPGFRLDNRETDVWRPLEFDLSKGPNQRGNHGNWVLARLKAGVTAQAANAEMTTLAADLERQYPRENAHVGAVAFILPDYMVGNIRPALITLFGAVGCVLLIACVNIANLLLARSASRRRELAVRAALGAGRGRIVRQLLTESLLLSSAAAICGLLLAWWGVASVRALHIDRIPRLDQIAVDGRALLFTALLAILTALVFGLLPAWRMSSINLSDALKAAGGRTTENTAQRRLRTGLVAVEAAMATLLLVGSGLLIRSFLRVTAVDAGFRSDHVLTAALLLPDARYHDEQKRAQFFDAVLSRVRNSPGVRNAAITSELPLMGGNNGTIMVEGKPRGPNTWDAPLVEFTRVSPGYFATMRIPLLHGRDIDAHDNKSAPHVVVVNESLARRFFPGENPIGKRIADFDTHPDWMQIVGVVGDVRIFGLEEKPIPQMYIPAAQEPRSLIHIVVHTAGEPASAASAVTRAVHEVDSEEAVFEIESMDALISGLLSWRTFNTTLLAAFGAIAMLLASIGIYGVISYSVTQRIPELGIRMALGASRRDVATMVVRQGTLPAVVGAAIGAALSLWAARMLSSLLYGVRVDDALTYLSVSALLVVVALAASYIPARRAASIDPSRALRYE